MAIAYGAVKRGVEATDCPCYMTHSFRIGSVDSHVLRALGSPLPVFGPPLSFLSLCHRPVSGVVQTSIWRLSAEAHVPPPPPRAPPRFNCCDDRSLFADQVCTELITNNAAAALATPIAFSISRELGVSVSCLCTVS